MVLISLKVMTWESPPIARISSLMLLDRINSLHCRGMLPVAKCGNAFADNIDRGGLGNPGAGPAYGNFVQQYENFVQAHMTDGMAIYFNVPSM